MPVRVERDGAVAVITVDNPPVNALDDATLTALGDIARHLVADAAVRAVVLTGAGDRTFLAGADLGTLGHALETPGAMEAHVALTRPTFDGWRALQPPLIAAVNAHAVGGGLEFALLCDLIVSDPRARFGLPEVKLGLIPGAGGTQRLPRRVGMRAALELIMLGDLIDAARARELGIVTSIAEQGAALREALALAKRLAEQPQFAVRAAKRLVRQACEPALDAGLDAEREAFLATAATADAREGVAAFLEKRRPAFVHA
jgi:enoyl-CoA hydratase/carnithine racemase